MSTTQRTKLDVYDAHELEFPDGTILRLRWDDGENGIKLTAEQKGRALAVELAVLPRSANGVILKAK